MTRVLLTGFATAVCFAACGPTLLTYNSAPDPIYVGGGRTNAYGAPQGSVAVNPGSQGSTAVHTAAPAAPAGATAHADMRRIVIAPAGEVAAGGGLSINGMEPARGLTVVDGELQLDQAQAARGAAIHNDQDVGVTGGDVILTSADGRRWHARVTGGHVRMHRNTSGAAHWRMTDGELQVQATAAGARATAQASAGAPNHDNGRVQSGGDAHGGGHHAAVAPNSNPNAGGSRPQPNGAGDPATPAAAAAPTATPPNPSATAAATPAPAPRHRRAANDRERRALDRLAQRTPHGPRAASRLRAAAHTVTDAIDDGPPMFYNIPIVGRSLAILLDVSYSMREPDPRAQPGAEDTPTRLDVLRASMIRLLASLPADLPVNIIAFSSTNQVLWDRPRTLDEANLQAAIDWAAALQPVDESHPLEAVQAADAMQLEQIILITDGRPTFAEEQEPQLLSFADTLQRRNARLDVVGIGPDQDAAYLDTLAARGRGIAVHL